MHCHIPGMIRRFRSSRRPVIHIASSLFLFAALSAAFAARAMAADIQVSGCNIAAAINSANLSPGSRVLIPQGTCTLASPLPMITQSMTIEGQGSGAIIDAGATNQRVLEIYIYSGGRDITLTRLTIRNGKNIVNPANPDTLGGGGGISWDAGGGGTLTINNCTIDSNTTDKGDGGGIAAYDSGASRSAKLVISNSTISNNTATAGAGGGIFVGQTVDLVMTGTSVTANKVGATAADFGQGGGLFLFGPAGATGSSISSGTFTNNSATGDGGAIYTTAPIAITTTYSGNSVGADGNGPDLWNNADGAFLLPTDTSPTISAGGTATFTEHGPAVVIDSGVIIGDSDNANLASATVTISAGFIASNDKLVFTGLTETDGTVTAKANGSITSSYNGSTGTLTLQGVATKEKYQAALRIVTFKNDTHYLPITPTPRAISFVVNDGKNNSSAATSTVNVIGVNDAPVLASATPTLAPLTEDDTANAGQLVSAIVGSTITDLDYNLTYNPTVGLPGIVVIAAAPGNGTWQYSLNNGSTWVDFGAVSASAALLLRSTDYVRFRPDGKNGTSASFTYRAWDQSDGALAGSKEDASITGGATPFSIGNNTASITVTSINDAPVFIGGTTNLTVTKDSAAVDISTLLHVSDPDTGQTETWTITGNPSHGTLSGFPATAASGSVDITPGGTVTYTPAAGYAGSDGFTVRVSDGIAIATRAITVAVMAPPIISNSFGAAEIPLNGSTSLTFTITNPTGNLVALAGVAFADNLPAGLVVATPNGLTDSCGGGTITATASSSTVSLSGATLATSSSCTFSVNVTGTTAGVKNNSVTVSSGNGGIGNTATTTITVTAADLALINTAPATAIPQNSLTYTITQTNNGPSAAQDVSITDTLPANTTFVSTSMAGGSGWTISAPAVGTNGTISFSKSSVAISETAIFQVTVQIGAGAANGSTISNTAVVTALTIDPDPANNASTATSTVAYPVRIELPGMAYFPTLSAACTNATSPNIIDAWGIEFAEVLTFNQGKTITLKGGYDSGFLSNNAATTVGSPLTVINGALTVEKIVIK